MRIAPSLALRALAVFRHARVGVARPFGTGAAPVPGQKFFADGGFWWGRLGGVHVAQVTRARGTG